MKPISPFASLPEAVRSLDNGGRFFDIFSKAQDGVISSAELSKASQNLINPQRMILFLELSMSRLDENEQELLLAKLDDSLQQQYRKHKPACLPIGAVPAQGEPESPVLLRGLPRPIADPKQFQGFTPLPIVINNITIHTWSPFTDSYRLYDLLAEDQQTSFLVAHPKGKTQLPPHPIALTGIIKTFRTGEGEDTPERRYVEIAYFCEE